MATNKDLYETLGVSKEASQAEIKRAYRKLVKEYHPDHNRDAGAGEKFKEIQEAYEVLGDNQKKESYDKFGHAGLNQGAGGMGGMGGFGGTGGASYTNFSDLESFFEGANVGGLFEQFFGGTVGAGPQGRHVSRPRQGDSLRTRIKLDFEDAAFGIEKTVEYKREIECNNCEGTGSENKRKKSCNKCEGSGRIQSVRQTMLGAVSMSSTCTECDGHGEIPEKKCPECDARGIKIGSEKLKIKVPRGAYDGMEIKFSGKGNAGEHGGDYGDLYVLVEVSEHELFTREGEDILIQYRIPLKMAVLGGETEIPTLHGDEMLKVPAGTQYGEVLILKNKGVPKRYKDKNGDQKVKIVFDIPKKISKKERKLWEEMKS